MRVRAFGLCGLLVAAVPAWGETWLEVSRITRLPRLPPPATQDAPKEAGWPQPGERIEWVAHVINRGPEPVAAVPYTWRIDGDAVADGQFDFPVGEVTVALPWRWSATREAVAFEIVPPATAADRTPDDDRLSVASDALSIGFRVEQGLYDWMAEDGRPGFERWTQGQIELWHRIFERSAYPMAPTGVLDRMRLDQVLVVADGTPGRHTDLDTDLKWYFTTGLHGSSSSFLHEGAMPQLVADQTIVLHELLHGRGLIDLYAFTVVHGDQNRTDSFVDIREDGRLVAGSSLMPRIGLGGDGITVFTTNINGVMGSQYRATARLTEHSVIGLNRRAGRRTPQWFDQWGNLVNGFANAAQADSYAFVAPERTELRVLDQDGRPLADATVEVYRDHSPHAYQKRYAATPDRVFRSDGAGVVVLPGDVLAGLPTNRAPPKAMTLIVGVRTSGARGYAFLPVWQLNMLHFRDPERGVLEVRVRLEQR